MSALFSIGEASAKTELNKKTIRFYEEIGLIASAGRKENNYRYFTQRQIKELKLKKKVRDLGMPINEIKKLMKGCGEKNCRFHKEDMLGDLERYVGTVDAKIKELTLLKEQLNTLKKNMTEDVSLNSSDKHCCDLLNQLSEIGMGGGDE